MQRHEALKALSLFWIVKGMWLSLLLYSNICIKTSQNKGQNESSNKKAGETQKTIFL